MHKFMQKNMATCKHGNHGNHGIIKSDLHFFPNISKLSIQVLIPPVTKKQPSVSLVHGNKVDVPRWPVKNHHHVNQVPQRTHATRPNDSSKLCPVSAGRGPPLFCPAGGEGVLFAGNVGGEGKGEGVVPFLKGNRQSNTNQTNHHHALNSKTWTQHRWPWLRLWLRSGTHTMSPLEVNEGLIFQMTQNLQVLSELIHSRHHKS